MANKNALADGTSAVTATKARLVHASVRELRKRSGQWDHDTRGEPVSLKYTDAAGYVLSTQVLESMGDQEWALSDDGIFMTRQALDFHRSYLLPGFHDAYVVVIRTALTDNVNALVPAATGPAGDPALTVIGVNSFDEAMGVAGKAFNAVLRYASTHDQDDHPQIHEELTDGR
ncbi:hypothetical protein [Streptomyces massasporeus]|uniref:hypothetical protein n=1 Tax=Streptomyces massasporeus TaxID=67324 RepID=UPI0033E7CA59